MTKLMPAIALASGLVASAASAITTVTVEAPGVQSTTVALSSSGVENFDSAPLGLGGLVTTYGGSEWTGTYAAINVRPADVFGGAGGIGRYPQVLRFANLTIAGDRLPNYFGAWGSALDGRNELSFYRGGVLLDTFNATNAAVVLPITYNCNPNGGGNCGEKYAFYNFHVFGGYDQITLTRLGGGFESDNHTVGVIPEPGTWALLVTGFGLIGFSMRRRARNTVSA